MNRTQSILVTVLAVQVVLIVLLRAPWAERESRAEARPLLPALEDATATRIAIGGGDDDASVTLVRDGEAWRVEQLDGFPAQTGKIDGAIDTLRGLTVRRPVATSPRYHSTFQLAADAPERRVRVWGDDGDEPLADLLLGSSPNYRTLHVRRAGDDAVYEVGGLSAYDFSDDPGAWSDAALLDVPRGEIVGLRLENRQGELGLERGEDGWRLTAPDELAGVTPDDEALGTFLGAISSLRLAEPAGRLDAGAQGFESPAATLTLRRRADTGGDASSAPRTVVVRVGRVVPDDEGRRYVTRDDLEFAGEIWAGSVEALLEQTAADLVADED